MRLVTLLKALTLITAMICRHLQDVIKAGTNTAHNYNGRGRGTTYRCVQFRSAHYIDNGMPLTVNQLYPTSLFATMGPPHLQVCLRDSA